MKGAVSQTEYPKPSNQQLSLELPEAAAVVQQSKPLPAVLAAHMVLVQVLAAPFSLPLPANAWEEAKVVPCTHKNLAETHDFSLAQIHPQRCKTFVSPPLLSL